MGEFTDLILGKWKIRKDEKWEKRKGWEVREKERIISEKKGNVEKWK